ncbi:hypothetical protein V2J09_010247 [Rumex salicifolius]
MAVIETESQSHNPNLQVHRLPQSKYVDGVRWLPPLSAFDKFAVLSLFDSDSSSSSIEICSVSSSSTLSPLLTVPSPFRTSSLRASRSHYKPLVAFSTVAGSFHLLSPQVSGELGSGSGHSTQLSLQDRSFHTGAISCIDGLDDGEFVTVGEDGRVNLVSLVASELQYRRVFDSNGLVSYSAVKWASPTEFATGGLGFSLQWWDQRKPGGPALQFKGNWPQNAACGIVHSIDIHPSRKHTCMAGGSSGTVFSWDLRWQQQPIILSGVGITERGFQSPSESEVWEVQYDSYTQSSHISSLSSSRTLPVMMCSEDGILAVIDKGMEPVELLAEPCAINSFDIDKQNPSNIICGLEWESVAILTRKRIRKYTHLLPLIFIYKPCSIEVEQSRAEQNRRQRAMAVASILPLNAKFQTCSLLPRPSIRSSHGINLKLSQLKLSSSYSISSSEIRPILRQTRNDVVSVPRKSSPPAIVAAKGYKMKTHKASAKRFRVTGSGKIMRRRAGKQHLLAKKNTKRKLRLSKMVQVNRSDYDNVIGCLPYLKVKRNAK